MDRSDRLPSTVSLICGAFAGLSVDLTLFPIDTVKTRLQSELGFIKSGGFRSIYSGIPSVAIGSAPGSALFFLTYDYVKSGTGVYSVFPPFMVHMFAASVGEVVACTVRVPTELVKQRAQAFPTKTSFEVLKNILLTQGLEGLYRGYSSTIAREIPFSFIEFPVWEFLKVRWSQYQKKPVTAIQGAACGSFAGAIAAALTTPLDVAKTRIMLSQKLHGDKLKVMQVLQDIYSSNGLVGLYAGCIPRTTWMALGGFIFFGAYEMAKDIFTYKLHIDSDSYVHRTIETYNRWKMFKKSGATEPRTFDDVYKEAQEIQKRRDDFVSSRKPEENVDNKSS